MESQFDGIGNNSLRRLNTASVLTINSERVLDLHTSIMNKDLMESDLSDLQEGLTGDDSLENKGKLTPELLRARLIERGMTPEEVEELIKFLVEKAETYIKKEGEEENPSKLMEL